MRAFGNLITSNKEVGKLDFEEQIFDRVAKLLVLPTIQKKKRGRRVKKSQEYE